MKVENVEFVLVYELDSTTRGDGGFGSTDIKSGEKTKQQIQNIADLYEKISGNIRNLKQSCLMASVTRGSRSS